MFILIKKMARKLPEIIHQDEFELLYKKIKELERKSGKSRAKRLREYRLAILLAFEAGMRISEIVGLKELVSICHNSKVIKKRELINGKNIIQRYCSECNNKLDLKDCHRIITAAWEVPPLTKEQIDFQRNSIKVISGKGNKDRFVPLPKRINEKICSMLPLKIKRSGLQRFTETFAKKELNKNISFHTLRHCVSEDTEILTETGWKNYKDLKVNKDKVFSYNLKNSKINLNLLKKINVYNYNGELYQIKNSSIDGLFTTEHKVLVNVNKEKQINYKKINSWTGWELIPIKKLVKEKNKRLVKTKLAGNFEGDLSIGKYKAGILGWLLTDGNIARENSPDITISQSLSANKNKCKYLEKLLKGSGLEFSKIIHKETINNFTNKPYTMVTFRLLNGGNRGKIKGKNNNWIKEWIDFKERTPKWKLLKLKNNELQELYKCIMMGDGTRNQELCTQNEKRINFFRVLCCLLGKRTSIGTKNQNNKNYHRTYISHKDTCNIQKEDIKKIKYQGKVWCPTTTDGTFIARRNETIFITGNSFATHFHEKTNDIRTLQVLLGHSRLDSLPDYTPIMIKENGNLDICSIEDLWNNIKRKDVINNNSFSKLVSSIKIFNRNKNINCGRYWSNINSIHRHKYIGKLIRLNSAGGVIDTSPNHSIISANAGKIKDANKLKIGDKLCIPNKEIFSWKWGLKDAKEMSFIGNLELAWLYGFFCAEGSISKNRIITLYNFDNNLLKKCKDILENNFYSSICISNGKNPRVTLCDRRVFNFFKNNFYTSQGLKRIPKFILNSNLKVKKEFLEGYNLGDGYHKNQNKFKSFTTNSQVLMAGLIFLIENTTKQDYNLFTRKDKKTIVQAEFCDNGKRKKDLREIKKIMNINYKGWLYDLSTNNETFCAGVGNIKVHNTTAIYSHIDTSKAIEKAREVF